MDTGQQLNLRIHDKTNLFAARMSNTDLWNTIMAATIWVLTIPFSI